MRRRPRLEGFGQRMFSPYARGMTVRESRGHLQELCGVEVSPDPIGPVTDAVLEEVREWRNRPLDPVMSFDALRVKIRDRGQDRGERYWLHPARATRRPGRREVGVRVRR